MPNVPYPYEVNWQIGHRKWFLNTNLFLIKQSSLLPSLTVLGLYKSRVVSGPHKMRLRVPQRPETRAVGPTWSQSFLFLCSVKSKNANHAMCITNYINFFFDYRIK